MQGTQVATQYMNDQLREELKRDDLVVHGKITRKEADEEGEEWAEVRVQQHGHTNANARARMGRVERPSLKSE